MKTFSTILFAVFSACAFSQGPVSNGCMALSTPTCNGTLIPLSTGASPTPVFTDTSFVSNPNVNPNSSPGNAGCLLAGEYNPNWILLSIETGGMLEFHFSTGGSSGFLDWIMWPYSASACQQIMADSLPPIACNWNNSSAGITGMADSTNLPSGAPSVNFENPIAVNAGDQFVICVSNGSSLVGNLVFTNTGSAGICQSTADISEETVSHKRELVKIVDVTGRVAKEQPNVLLFYIYDDGSSERVYRTE